jgi:MscS family membrane protein
MVYLPSTRCGVLAIALVILGLAQPAVAADPERETPRAAARGFFMAARNGHWEQATEYLDLGGVPAGRRSSQGPRLARQLAIVVERTLALDTDTLSDDPAGDRQDGLAADIERLGTIQTKTGPADVLLRRTEADGAWRFAPRTVARVPALYAEFGYGVVDLILPRPLVEIRFLDVALWQWLALLLLGVVAWLGSWIVIGGLGRVARRLAARAPFQGRLVAAVSAPARAGAALAIFAFGVLALALALPVLGFITTLERAATVLVIAWAALCAMDVLASVVTERLAARGQSTAVAMVPIGSRTAKVFVLILAVLATLQNVGVNVTGLLAGLGIGGLAVALAAQKTVENLFGGVTLIVDQPVRVGDFCRFGERVGTIEEIGLRSTRIRTLDRTLVSVPNAEFAGLQLENFARRDRIWLQATLGLRYETTPDQLRSVLQKIGDLLREHPRVDPDPARIRFVGFGAYALECEIFAYIRTADQGEFLAIREELLLAIMDAVEASGTAFAFPSQTIYMGRDTGLDGAKRDAAEAQGTRRG